MRRVVGLDQEINTLESPGCYIEDVKETEKGYAPGVALIDWDSWGTDIYLMNRHPGWGEETYFQFAEERVQELHLRQGKGVVDKADVSVRKENQGGGQ